jgi:hypothetical protein
MPNLYALLVGINRYPDPIPRLTGCVNDVDALANYLQHRIHPESGNLYLRVLKDEAATRDAVIDAFREHLGQATQADEVLFAYSGHGSQEPAPPAFWQLEPDHMNETLVCWDSRLPDKHDLADKELACLISVVAAKTPRMTVILDCCHSGSGSRVMNARYIEPDSRPRTLESYWLGTIPASRSEASEVLPTPIPQGRHVLLAACRDVETAKEYQAKQRGAFSYFLLETLIHSKSSLSYREVFKQANALIRGQVPNQTPQIEATHPEDLDRGFLGGTVAQTMPYFLVSHHPTLWMDD